MSIYKISTADTVRKVTLTGVFIALAVVINTLSGFYIPIGGVPMVKITFGGPFIIFTAIAAGPLYGGIAAAATDIITFLLKPIGGYIPPLTVVAFLKSFLIGYFWLKADKLNTRYFNIAYVIFFAVAGVLGGANLLWVSLFPGGGYAGFIGAIGVKSVSVTLGLIYLCAAGLLTFLAGSVINAAANRRRGGELPANAMFFRNNFLKLIVCVGVPSLLGTTANTLILKQYMLLGDKAFMFLWIPRIVESALLVFYNTYFLTVILHFYSLRTRRRIL